MLSSPNRCLFRKLIKSTAITATANLIAQERGERVFDGPPGSVADSMWTEITLTKPKTPCPSVLQHRAKKETLSFSVKSLAFLPQDKPSPRSIHSRSLHSFERKTPSHTLGVGFFVWLFFCLLVVFTQWLNRSLQNVKKLIVVFKNQTPWSIS